MLPKNTMNNDSEVYKIKLLSKINNLEDIKNYNNLEISLSYLLFYSFKKKS